MKKRKKNFKNSKNSLNKLSLFQKSDMRFSRKCPFSVKNAPIIDYKNIALLQKYITETNKIITSKISNVSLGKQKKLAREIKKAKITALRTISFFVRYAIKMHKEKAIAANNIFKNDFIFTPIHIF